MAFTMVTLVGNIETGAGIALDGAVVSATLSDPIVDGVTWLEPVAVTATVASNGSFSLGPLPANTDETTIPAGTSYLIKLINGPLLMASFSVIVPNSPTTIDLFSLAELGTAPDVSYPFLLTFNGRNGAIQLEGVDFEAGTGITISVVDGVVEISSDDHTDVATETARAEAAEATNATAISAETTRAEAAEALKATITALTAETTRAEAAEAAAITTAEGFATSASATALSIATGRAAAFALVLGG